MKLRKTFKILMFTAFLFSYLLGMLNLLNGEEKGNWIIYGSVCFISLTTFLLSHLTQKGKFMIG